MQRVDRDGYRPLPEQFTAQLRSDMGDEVELLIEALDGESPTSIRVNPYKIDRPLEGEQSVPWSRYGYYLADRPSFTYDSAFHAGAYYVQEASSQFVGHILSSVEGELEGAKVLDTCAAPGGKSTLYSTLVGLEGLVVACEVNRSRAAVLADNVRRWGLGNIAVVTGDASQISPFESMFDCVAVDAPCSGEGMFRKSYGARDEWSVGGVMSSVERQRELLRSVWATLKPGGILLYSTCTFNRLENEGVIEEFEQWCDGEVSPFERVELGDDWGIKRGEVGSFQTFRFMPHMACGEGFFVAVARKSFDAGGRVKLAKGRKRIFAPLSRADLQECMRWLEQPELMTLQYVGDTVYGYYNSHFELVKRLAESLSVIYSGVAIGQLFKGRLNPDGALALFVGLSRDVVGEVTLDGDELLSYLRRQDISPEGLSEGFNLITDSRGYALGFAKRIGQRVNNRYPNSLRILK